MKGRRSAGFTMMELVIILLILGILSVAVLPRLTDADQSATVFRDQTSSALRYAQKTAVSHRREVCVSFSATSVSLSIASNSAGPCDTPLPLPGGPGNSVSSRNAAKAFFNPAPEAFSFLADGTGADRSITVNGLASITVAGATGYVE